MSNNYMILYCVEVKGNGFRWFKDKDEAIIFTSLYYNVEVETVSIDHSPIYKHPLKLDSKSICKFLNDREVS